MVVKLEVDLSEGLEGKSQNKITINMYDKDVMPVVDDLYLNDQANGLMRMKAEGRQEEVESIFSSFIESVEN